MFRTNDSIRATNPADEFLSSDHGECEPRIITRYDPPPIPTNAFNWVATEEDYDLGRPVGYGASEAEAIRDLLDQLED
jgi:hypothetical protein